MHMSMTQHLCLYCSKIIKSGATHVKCDEEQGRRLSSDLCLVCAKPMGSEHNVEHTTCYNKAYKGYPN